LPGQAIVAATLVQHSWNAISPRHYVWLNEPVSQHSGTKSLIAAMSANIAIAIMKAVGWLLTGAASMLAEAIHSVADSANQVLMLVGSKAAKKQPDSLHQFGYGRNRYIAAFLVAIILFSMGGLFALYEAYHKFAELRAGHPNDLLESQWWWVPVAVLVGAIVAESFSLRTALKEASEARGTQSLPKFIRTSRAPELPVVMLEDLAALTGLVLALAGISLTLITGNGYFDVIGSAFIGLLLVAVAILLAIEIYSLLIGESATPEATARIRGALESTRGIQQVVHLRTLHIGPEEILVAAKIAVDATDSAETIAGVIDSAESAVRTADRMANLIYLEPDLLKPTDDQVSNM
jgi:cation diffusion facilitator family transporter